MTDKVIFVTSIRLRNGRRIFASQYGLKAFPIKVSTIDPPRQLKLPGVD